MQGTVWEFDDTTHRGHIVLDDGRLVDISPEAFEASGLRLLRLGQRVRFDVDTDNDVRSLTILTLPDADPHRS
ncbi:MAG: cold-shock protein [Nocardioidaceae bacterium]|nr:cold-shock protein [Nocardioidaceae bacterium]